MLLTAMLFASIAPASDAKLEALFDSYLKESFRYRPLDAIRLGAYEHAAGEGSPGVDSHKAMVELLRRTQQRLQTEIDAASLSADGKIDREVFARELERSLWIEENLRPHATDPRVVNEYTSDAVYLLLTQCTLPQGEKLKLCRQRIEQIPAILKRAKESLKDPPYVLVETGEKQNRGAIAFYESHIYEVAGETPQFSSLRDSCQRAVAALKEYGKFLESDLKARADGDWRIGKEKFAKKFDIELDAGISAEELVAEAEREYARVEAEMATIARQLWWKLFPKEAAPPSDPAGRRETVRRVLAKLGESHSTPESVLADAKRGAEAIKKFIAERDILRLPTPDRCKIIEMPEFQRGNSTAYLNAAPPLDAKAESMYAISPPPSDWSPERKRTLLEEYNDYMLQILTIHEAYPGHYVQLEYSNRHPSRIRRILQSGVFVEGWAVYTEQTMLDQGYGAGDLALRLHQLKFYLRAVVNTILDYKMHCQNLTDEEAMKLLVDGAFQSDAEARLKVVRAKQSSCQLCTYFAGRTMHVRMRNAVQRELGAAFDLGRYHEAVLSHGSLPMKYLPALVRERLKQPR